MFQGVAAKPAIRGLVLRSADVLINCSQSTGPNIPEKYLYMTRHVAFGRCCTWVIRLGAHYDKISPGMASKFRTATRDKIRHR